MANGNNSQPEGSEPVGGGDRVIQSGECVASIAEETGHFWSKLWELPENNDLKRVRKDPNVLLAGDRMHVPPIEPKKESGATEARHRFKRKGVPSKLRIQVKALGEPLKDRPYTLEIDGVFTKGRTDADGFVEATIPPGAREGRLVVGEEPHTWEWQLDLGGLDPITTVTGVKHRLNGLGYAPGEGPEETAELREAVMAFQRSAELDQTGELDDQTRAKLDKVFRDQSA